MRGEGAVAMGRVEAVGKGDNGEVAGLVLGPDDTRGRRSAGGQSHCVRFHATGAATNSDTADRFVVTKLPLLGGGNTVSL